MMENQNNFTTIVAIKKLLKSIIMAKQQLFAKGPLFTENSWLADK